MAKISDLRIRWGTALKTGDLSGTDMYSTIMQNFMPISATVPEISVTGQRKNIKFSTPTW